MAELVCEAALSAGFQYLLDKLDSSSELVNYLRGKNGCDFEELLTKLKTKLFALTAVLDDAEHKQIRNPGVKNWLDELQDAVYEAEDCLGEIEYDALKHKMQEAQSSTSTVTKVSGSFFSTFLDSTDRERKTRLEKILRRLEDFVEQRNVLGLEQGTAGKKPWPKLPSTSLIDFEVYGRDDVKNAIMDQLLMSPDEGCREITVIPIVGMGGIGKTTLAQQLYNDEKVEEYFDFRAWVCVTAEFDACRVTQTILGEKDGTDLNSLQAKLKERLKGVKSLIVLDDLWNENYNEWVLMKTPFSFGAQGSKIIVTTRNENVANITRSVVPAAHYLKELKEDACWKLFAKHAFGGGDPSTNLKLESIGREIVKKCNGLPLAAKTLGGLLRHTTDVEEWERISTTNLLDFTEEKSDVLPVLRLSYYYLPSHLKRCFAYCSIFPKGYTFDKENLVLLWMAENLLEQSKGNKRIEDLGNVYFNDLVSRSFFQLSGAQKSIFVMHDLIHDLAKFVSRDYCLLLEDDKSNKIGKRIRHLACIMKRTDPYQRLDFDLETTHLCTFLPNVHYDPWDYEKNRRRLDPKILDDLLLKLRCLKVLSLHGYRNIKQLPHSIGELRQLRYLDLSNTDIIMLSESVIILYNLQTLKLCYCRYLNKLPKDMYHLINLRYLDVSGSPLVDEMPSQLSKLKKLQMLSTFIVGKDSGVKIGELRELSGLRGHLDIRKLENVENVEDVSDQAKLMDKKHLERLRLEWSDEYNSDDSRHERNVLDMLLPNESLKELEICGYLSTTFSDWLGKDSFCDMVSIKLSGCKNCASLPPLGQLPFLKNLEISGFDAVVNVSLEFYGNSSVVKPFSSLETLKFESMSSWEQWDLIQIDNENSFRKLKELEMSCCDKLIGNLPRNLPSLERLKINKCKQLDSLLPKIPWIRQLELCDCENLLLKVGSLFEALKKMEAYPRHLSINNCSSLVSIGCPYPSLETLKINNCEELELALNLPYESLECLDLVECNYSLRYIPLDSFPNLKRLEIWGLKSLESLTMPDGLTFPSLSSLSINNCPNFVSFGRLPGPNLTFLRIFGCKKLESLPERMHILLPSLRNLVISSCPAIESFPEGGLPINLSFLKIVYCDKLIALRQRVKWNLQTLPNLKGLFIVGCEDQVESFPEEGLLPPTITWLKIYEFPSLKALNNNALQQLSSLKELYISDCPKLLTMPEQGLPTSLQLLLISNCPKLLTMPEQGLPTSLQKLWIFRCPNLQTLPGKRLPTSLKELSIYECPVLVKMCEPDNGEYWNKIAHIPYIDINGEVVS